MIGQRLVARTRVLPHSCEPFLEPVRGAELLVGAGRLLRVVGCGVAAHHIRGGVMLKAISSAVTAPIFSPAGYFTLCKSSGETPLSLRYWKTAFPLFGLAIRATAARSAECDKTSRCANSDGGACHLDPPSASAGRTQ